MKQREDLIKEPFLNKAQIGRLLGLSPGNARKLYKLADEIDEKELKEYRIEKNKVRAKSVEKVSHISFDEIKKRTIA